MSNKIEKLYKFLRVIIYLAPVAIIMFGAFVVLFPNENFTFDSKQPNAADFEIQKDPTANILSFGVYPKQTNRYIDLNVDAKESAKGACTTAMPTVIMEKTHQAFLDPVGDSIADEDQLRQYLFDGNSSDYPNGTLLHSKATDQVFLLTQGKKMLFPSPEIFRSFGYSFDNLTDVDQAAIDQFPDAENKVFSWSIPHPDDTIFEAYPSHTIYLIANGQKHEIVSSDILNNVWQKNYAIAVSDIDSVNAESCSGTKFQVKNGDIQCQLDSTLFSQSLGGFYQFILTYPNSCSVNDVHVGKATVNFISEKTLSSVKNSIQNIFASILNRYFRS